MRRFLPKLFVLPLLSLIAAASPTQPVPVSAPAAGKPSPTANPAAPAAVPPRKATPAAEAPSRPPVAEVVTQLQKSYESIAALRAKFAQTLSGPMGKRTASGTVALKKPGKMRWDYTSPEVKQFVSDGIKVYSYIPADKQVLVGTVPPDDTAGSPALFLAGKGDLVRDYTASNGEVPAGTAAGTRALKLVPRKPQQDYDWLVLLVDPVSLSLRGMVTVDAQGGRSVFSFSNLKENIGLADKDFEFHMPRGVDVVTDAGGR